jgi:hypothetical protein
MSLLRPAGEADLRSALVTVRQTCPHAREVFDGGVWCRISHAVHGDASYENPHLQYLIHTKFPPLCVTNGGTTIECRSTDPSVQDIIDTVLKLPHAQCTEPAVGQFPSNPPNPQIALVSDRNEQSRLELWAFRRRQHLAFSSSNSSSSCSHACAYASSVFPSVYPSLYPYPHKKDKDTSRTNIFNSILQSAAPKRSPAAAKSWGPSHSFLSFLHCIG